MALGPRKVEEAAPALVRLYKEAGKSLRRHGIDGQRVAVHLVVDYSGPGASSSQDRPRSRENGGRGRLPRR